MNFDITINGIDVHASYSEKSVEEIFIPLLKLLAEKQKEANRRILVMLAAPPAAGKSTLLAFLKHLSETTPRVKPITTIGMDGFHRYQDYLLTHTMLRDGQEVSMVSLKGAPETFDLELLAERIKKVAAGANCGWPEYNRMLHNPVENAIQVTGDIVLLEGNYLLLDWPGWRNLKASADYTIRILAEEQDLRERLINRKAASGTDYEEAVKFVENSDLYNARTCLRESMEADLTLRMMQDGEYVRE